MRAGNLKERIQIQTPIDTRDPATNQAIKTWAKFGSVTAAEVVQNSGGESNVQGQVTATRQYTVTIRRSSRDGLLETMRLLWLDSRGRTQATLHIVSIGFDAKRRMVQFVCKS